MDSFQQQALEFNMPNSDFDPNSVPTDGEQYLQKVFYERAKCPAVVVKPLTSVKPTSHAVKPVATIWTQYTSVSNPISTHPPISHFFYSTCSSIGFQEDIGDRADISLLPTKEWSRHQMRTFKSLRNKIAGLRSRRNKISNGPTRSHEEIAAEFPTDDDDSNAWQTYCERNEPLLSIMFTIHQRTLEKLIEHQSNWLTDDVQWYTENSKWLSRWIYGSLACLHLPLEPNVHNSLRQIAKTCIRLRNQISDGDATNVLPLNLVICIVARNFNQLDLCGRTR